MTSKRSESKVKEAAVEYIVGGRTDASLSTISTKNQITLPAHLLRELGLAAGDRVAVTREGNRLVLRARPRDWVEYHGRSLRGLYGRNPEEIEAYIKELRDESDRE